jgi:hypothetical protein
MPDFPELYVDYPAENDAPIDYNPEKDYQRLHDFLARLAEALSQTDAVEIELHARDDQVSSDIRTALEEILGQAPPPPRDDSGTEDAEFQAGSGRDKVRFTVNIGGCHPKGITHPVTTLGGDR